MIHLRPFRAWRPPPHLAQLVGSRSFLHYSPEELRARLAGNPYSFLQIVHADHDRTDLTREQHFDAVRAKFIAFTRSGILLREERPALYVYEQSTGHFRSCGLIAAVEVEDYREGRIKVHEHTLPARERLFADYLEHTGINAEPVLLACPGATSLEGDLARITGAPALFDFSTVDRVRHRFWKVEDPEGIRHLQDRFKEVAALYIADGHHRCASSAVMAQRAHAAPGSPKAGFLAFIVPERQLHIYNFDRAVKGLNGLSPDEFLRALERVGPVAEAYPGKSPAPGCVQVFCAGRWLEVKFPPPATAAPADALAAELLNKHILEPLLGISELRTDPRVQFVPGTLGLPALEERVNSGKADAAFHLAAVTFGELRAVADSGTCMPPKSTWIEPKLRSGLTIYSLEEA